jgi:hypothetical protein
MSRKRQEKRNEERKQDNPTSARYVCYTPKNDKLPRHISRRIEQQMMEEIGDYLGFSSILRATGMKRYY